MINDFGEMLVFVTKKGIKHILLSNVYYDRVFNFYINNIPILKYILDCLIESQTLLFLIKFDMFLKSFNIAVLLKSDLKVFTVYQFTQIKNLKFFINLYLNHIIINLYGRIEFNIQHDFFINFKILYSSSCFFIIIFCTSCVYRI